jgi:predicted MPP superfamily phosphohydrolase
MKTRWRDRLARIIAPPPFTDVLGRKGVFERLTRYQPHHVRTLTPDERVPRSSQTPVRCVFLSDFHTGSHSGDVARFENIAGEVGALEPDLVLLGGDYVNMMLFGGGRVPPERTAQILGQIPARIGTFAVLGNHDREYGSAAVTDALRAEGITVLDDEIQRVIVHGRAIDIAGIPDARHHRPKAGDLMCKLDPAVPAIVIAHDPACFAFMPQGPHLMLAGHTHGGQIRIPGLGAVVNASHAPLRWTYGLINEGGRLMYVTSGFGTSTLPVRIGIPPEYLRFDF